MKKSTLLFLSLLFLGASQPVRADLTGIFPEGRQKQEQYEQAVCPDGSAAIVCDSNIVGTPPKVACAPYINNPAYSMIAQSPGGSFRYYKYCLIKSFIWPYIALGVVVVVIIGGWWWFGKPPQKAITKKSKASK